MKSIVTHESRNRDIIVTDHWIQKVRPIQRRKLKEEIELCKQQTS